MLSGACPFQPGVSKFDIHPSAQAPITAGTLVEKTNPARRCTAACRARHRRCQLAPSCALVMWQVGGWAPAAAAGGGTWPRPLQRSPGARSCPAAEWRAICRLLRVSAGVCLQAPLPSSCSCPALPPPLLLLVSACRHRSPQHVPEFWLCARGASSQMNNSWAASAGAPRPVAAMRASSCGRQLMRLQYGNLQ